MSLPDSRGVGEAPGAGRTHRAGLTGGRRAGVTALYDRVPQVRSARPGLGADNGVIQMPGLGADYGVIQMAGLGADYGVTHVPGLGADNMVTQVPGMGAGNGVTQVPAMGADNGVTQVPGLGADNGVTLVPGLGADYRVTLEINIGMTHMPGLRADYGVTLGTDDGVTQVPGLGVDDGVTLRSDNGVRLATDNEVTPEQGLWADNEVTQGTELGAKNGVTEDSELRVSELILRAGNGMPQGLGTKNCMSQGPRQGDAKLRVLSKSRSKRRESSGDSEGQIGCVVGRKSSFTCPLVTIRKSENRMTASRDVGSPNKRGQLQENRGLQKKLEGRGQRRQVTVDSSKAKTSLEAVKISIKQLKWKEFPHGRRLPCDIYWHGVSFHESENICSGQVNKFPGMMEMVRKINLSRAVRTMQELFPEEYNFYPQSWILPDEYHLFTAEVRMAKENDPTWKPAFIVKPDSGCQGDGIYLIKDPSEIRIMASVQNRPSVVQEYISKPLVIDKLKFDMRLYVVLKSLEPLEIYIAKDGLSRFCTEPYQEPNHKNLHHVYMHLTNYSLNAHSGNFIHSDSVHTGSKRTFSSILYRLSTKGVDVKKVWSDIISLVIKTVIALIPELKVYYQADIPPGKPGPTCFQILGFDILLMKNLKPVLLEVNANPSMKIEHEQELFPGVYENVPSLVDEEVKIAVIRDTLRLVDPARRRNSHNQPHSSDSGLNRKTDPQTGATEPAESEGNLSPENNLPSLCLKQVFPKYSKQFSYLRVVERIAALFIRFLGMKGTMKMGPTGFRTFIRSCKLSGGNFSMASGDILYIDITRRWSSVSLDQRESGHSAKY
ncbi:tubulin polyglutamylase TTLL11 isoform X2 [Mixophyes fleayi]|uniref:tubulin polyglutamylase TTLL11 isoform X2 n=1 Tax=Mixophyes fleayi TaxID=3061075 RepID=UPI003F4DD40E